MSYRRNSKKAWTREQVSQLGKLARENTPLIVMAFKLGRSQSATRRKAAFEGISLKLSNQSPYGTRRD